MKNNASIYKTCKKLLIERAIPYWQGRTSDLKRLVEKFLHARRHDSAYLKRLTRMALVSTAFTLMLLGINVSSASAAITFVPQTGTSNPLNFINDGTYVTPGFVDVDGDGDRDLFTGGYYGTFKYYQNTGTVFNPVYTQRTGAANPLNGVDTGSYSHPMFVNIDSDGDQDMFSYDYGTTAILYYKNTGTATAPVFTAQTGAGNPFNGITGMWYAPAFADMDADGDLDAFAVTATSGVNYYQNTGTLTAPLFVQRTGASNPLNMITSSRYDGIGVGDLDSDGDNDVLVIYGSPVSFNFYENTGTASSPAFTQRTGAANPFNGFTCGSYPSVSFIDYDYDGDPDLFTGDINGVVKFWLNTTPRQGGAGIDTFPPTLQNVQALSLNTIRVVYNEAMGLGVFSAGNYTISGAGQGTLASNPDSIQFVHAITGDYFVMTWNTGSLTVGQPIQVSINNVADALGNVVTSPLVGTTTLSVPPGMPLYWAPVAFLMSLLSVFAVKRRRSQKQE